MRLALCAVYIFMGTVLFAIPNMTRHELLFAVPVPPDFRASRAGRHAIRMFRTVIAAVALTGAGALLLAPAELLRVTATAVPLAILLVGGISFYWQNRKLAPSAVQFTRPREAELTDALEDLPRLIWLAVGPFAILTAVATWLYFHWDSIPARFPVHWVANGQSNGWAERTTKGVYGPLIFGAELCGWFLIMTLAGWYGSRRSRYRATMLRVMISAEYLVGLLFALIALQALLGIPAWVIGLAPMAILIPLILVVTKKMGEPGDQMEATPNECWKGAIFYYNPNDAALFVEKRDGWGYTFNFANSWSWVLLLGLVLVIASAPFVLA